MEAMLTIRPYFCCSIAGTIALQQMKGPSRLMRSTLRHSSRSVSHTVLLTPAMPALLTRMSILPNAFSVSSRVFSTAALSVTSTWKADTALPMACAVLSASALSWSQIATFAPEATKRSVIALPNPCAPPVTTAVRPLRSILFMLQTLVVWMSEHVAAVDDEVDAGGERAFVAGEIHRYGRDFVSGAQPAHLLAGDELFASVGARRGSTLQHRGRFHRAGADAVAADALGDEVGSDRAREQRDRGLGCAVDVAVGRRPQRRAGRDVDDAAASACQHRRQERSDGPVHGLDVEVERKIPVLLRTVQDGAVVHEARCVEQDIDLANALGEGVDVSRAAHVEPCRLGDAFLG